MRSLVISLLLCVPPLSAQEAMPPTRERYETLLKEYEAAEAAWNKRVDEGAKDNAEVDWTASYRDWPGWSFAPRFLKLAEADPDDPAAIDALIWVVNRAMNVGVGDRELYSHYRRALELLARGDHLDDKRLGRACTQGLRYATAPTESFLRVLADRSRVREVRGRASLALAKLLVAKGMIARNPWFEEKAKSPSDEYRFKRLDPDYLKYLRGADPRASEAEAEGLFERAIKEYGDIVYRRATGEGDRDLTIADAARSELHELRDLAVGKVAPEIAGEDLDGRPMRLSDYRGKIVVLTFWATWCGPCMGLVPHERALVDRLAGKTFVLLGIDGDEDREQARKVAERERISWRSWWNGGPSGPITEQYSIEGWPTVYVLDAKGVIRYKQVIKERLDEAVDTLLKEMETGTP